jgi:hypothetical protein
MEVMIINESSGGLFTVLLPVCDVSILSKVLDPDVPFVSLLGFWSDDVRNWIEQNLPPLFDADHRVESVQVKMLEIDVSLATADFLRLLPYFSGRGVDLIQATRPIPRRLSVAELKPESKARVFREVGVELQFYLPHPHENALAASPSKKVLERIVTAFYK